MAGSIPAVAASSGEESGRVFAALKAILTPYAKRLRVTVDSQERYWLETATACFKGKPVFFGGVRRGAAAVCFHLMPVYACPEMLQGMSPGLKKRMHGKSCFNFKTVDEALLAELKALTSDGFARFTANGFVQKRGRAISGERS